ncbi:MAG: triose-phosphate isomerase [Pseudomonadota bacterium]|nr:triose-phosphate isomerase [Pseudomonadota bacterium]
MRQILVAGNWKLNGLMDSSGALLESVKAGMGEVGAAEVAVCPPYVYLPMAREALSGSSIKLGAQDVCDQDKGAFTGEVSAPMLAEFGCRYVIVGHSERRSLYGDSDDVVAKKFAAATRAGLIPILCVGELLEEREHGTTESVVSRQIDAVISQNGIEALARSVVAYEPVWAIGTGKTASPEQAEAVHAFIRQRVARQDAGVAENLRILYGGSVKGSNASELFSMPNIDGGLIGGASLDAGDFLRICEAG